MLSMRVFNEEVATHFDFAVTHEEMIGDLVTRSLFVGSRLLAAIGS